MKLLCSLLLAMLASAQQCGPGFEWTVTDGCQAKADVIWVPMPIVPPGTVWDGHTYKLIDKLPGWECIVKTGTCCAVSR